MLTFKQYINYNNILFRFLNILNSSLAIPERHAWTVGDQWLCSSFSSFVQCHNLLEMEKENSVIEYKIEYLLSFNII